MITRLKHSKTMLVVRNNLHRMPWLRAVAVNLHYRTERRLLAGRHRTTSTHPSIIHFSVNKAATQYVKRILTQCASDAGMTPVQFNQYAFLADLPFFDLMTEEQFRAVCHVFKPQGYCYTVFGGMVSGIPDLDRYLKVLVTRDPRDVLTSDYFSEAFFHPMPGDPEKAARFEKIRDNVRNMSVDRYVLARQKDFAVRYRAYIRGVAHQPNVYITTYEDMTADFGPWLDRLLAFCQLEPSARTRAALIDEAVRPAPTADRVTQKRRQVTPGDHRRKLKPETIEALDAELADVLDFFGYQRTAMSVSGETKGITAASG